MTLWNSTRASLGSSSFLAAQWLSRIYQVICVCVYLWHCSICFRGLRQAPLPHHPRNQSRNPESLYIH